MIAIFRRLSVESNPALHWLSFTKLCDWFGKLAPPSQTIRCKTKTIGYSLFTALEAAYMYLLHVEFSLASCDVNLFSDWLL